MVHKASPPTKGCGSCTSTPRPLRQRSVDDLPPDRAAPTASAIHGEVAMANAGGATIRVRRLWEPPADMFAAGGHGGHGGGDERMLTAQYGPADPADEPEPGDAARRSANQRDGALALIVGVAANECFLTGQPVRIADLVEFRP